MNPQNEAGSNIIVGMLFRDRGPCVRFRDRPIPQEPEPARRPAKVARMLALAHHVQGAIDSGRCNDRASVAATLGLTRARITQVLDLLLLAPDIQEAIASMEAIDGSEPLPERALRPLTRDAGWVRQRALWRELVAARGLGCPEVA